MSAPVETEVKFRVESRAGLEERLTRLGAAPSPVESESNVLFDDDARSLMRRGEALRIRTVDGKGLVTFKGRARHAAGVKSRTELESDVSDPERMSEVFRSLGFAPRFTYEKRRTTWRFTDPARPLVTIDETPIGLFAEIEGTEADVRALARELDVAEAAFLRQSYAALYFAAREKDPTLPPDMRF